MIQESITKIIEGNSLSTEEASNVMNEIMNGDTTPAQIASFITALRMKGESVEEVVGMATAMRQHSIKINISGTLVDTCGTGGDGSNTFNISTASSVAASAAGLKIAKHGNRSASSICGSADVLEECGVKIDMSPSDVAYSIEKIGIGFMFAPIFHPAMKHAGPPRREIGIRTIFNILGPLTNPANAQIQILGIARKELGFLMAETLRRLKTHKSFIVHGEDGIDEFTLSGQTYIWEISDDTILEHSISPEDVGLTRSPLSNLKGGSIKENKQMLESVLDGTPGSLQDSIAFNTGAAIYLSGNAKTFKDGVNQAKEILTSGLGRKKLEEWVDLSSNIQNTK
ncbi:MAG: anthranilate phosphoribosyltransferase [Chloroflexi bacterium]|nr:anthranilate phosphoribosyltransferase [Chloroflexota bacterium]|tara:strand:- start:17770 stop:18792 length:1023 start_codon:yes stop_codon:yes gene_type:complete